MKVIVFRSRSAGNCNHNGFSLERINTINKLLRIDAHIDGR